jgi:uncharacterized membrane protein SirB2
MEGWTFPALVILVLVGVAVYIGWFVWGVKKHNWRFANLEGCRAYSEVARALITSSGIAAAILVAVFRYSPCLGWLIRRSVVLLVVSIISSICFMMIFLRSTEAAVSRERVRNPNADYGALTNKELTAILIPGAVSLAACLLGFLYLARIAFHL